VPARFGARDFGAFDFRFAATLFAAALFAEAFFDFLPVATRISLFMSVHCPNAK
jgi:hypothetical protein